MSDKALENAEMQRTQLLEQRTALREQLAAIEAKLASAERFIHDWHQYAGTEESAFANAPATPRRILHDLTIERIAEVKRRRNTKKEVVAAYARQIIERRNAVVSRADLFNELTAEGCVIEGSEPEMVLSTMLWRAGKSAGIVRLKSGGYWLAEVANPEAGYDPFMETAAGPVLPQDVGFGAGLLGNGDSADDGEDESEDANVAVWHRVSEIVLADMETARIESVNGEIRRYGGVPQDVDDALVTQARSELERDLSPADRQALLDVFTNEVNALVS